LLVEDRNGNPKKLKKKSFALASSISAGQTELRDGSIQDPINLKLLQELFNGNGVLVKNQQGVIGAAVPTEGDTFLAYIGGVLQFVKTVPKSNIFVSDELSSQSGRIAVIGCESNNLSHLGYFTDSGDYLASSEGNISAKNFCDAEDSEELDYLIGCSNGILKKIAPVEGKSLVESDGKWKTIQDGNTGEEIVVGGSSIYTKNYSSPSSLNYSETAIPFGPSVPNTAKLVQLVFNHYCAFQTYYCSVNISCNNLRIITAGNAGSFQVHGNSSSLYVPYGTGSFSINSTMSPASNASGSFASGSFTVAIASYK
tara:strand:+ start:8273 stop:9208 length:936 start_codon:yes stop_codon:yes gene_type:complete